MFPNYNIVRPDKLYTEEQNLATVQKKQGHMFEFGVTYYTVSIISIRMDFPVVFMLVSNYNKIKSVL